MLQSEAKDTLLPFHHHRQYEDQLIDLLNSEWPQSRTVRLRTLEKSSDQLPIALMFITKIDDLYSTDSTLIGHSALCSIPNRPQACWVQSVVVDNRLRGRGYGKRLMLATEKYAKEILNMDTMYLSTHDRQGFYERLGYEICPPVFNVGSNSRLFDDERFKKFTEPITNNSDQDRSISDQGSKSVCSISAPPPPPPMPQTIDHKEPIVVFMVKKLTID